MNTYDNRLSRQGTQDLNKKVLLKELRDDKGSTPENYLNINILGQLSIKQ